MDLAIIEVDAWAQDDDVTDRGEVYVYGRTRHPRLGAWHGVIPVLLSLLRDDFAGVTTRARAEFEVEFALQVREREAV